MGYGQVTHCSNCNDEKEYTLGAGMAFGDLFNVIDNFPKGAQNKIKFRYRPAHHQTSEVPGWYHKRP